MIYIYNDNDVKTYRKNMKYWSNVCGDLYDGNYDGDKEISEQDLPAPLQRAYKELWEEDLGAYLCEYCGQYCIALNNEYYLEDLQQDIPGATVKDLNMLMIRTAEKLCTLFETQLYLHVDAIIWSRDQENGIEDHILQLLMDADTLSKSDFYTVASTLYQYAYDVKDVPFKIINKLVDSNGNRLYVCNDLADTITNLSVGERIDCYEYDPNENALGSIAHCAEKICWMDSVVVLVGGYGGDVKCCYLPSQSCCQEDKETVDDIVALKDMLDSYFNVANITTSCFAVANPVTVKPNVR